MRGPIALVGLMGSGKTSVGKALARHLGLEHVDLDAALEGRHGLSVARQFAERGEAEFRRRESRALKALLKPGRVLSTGGGVVLDAGNRVRLKACVTVFLRASPAVLAGRLKGSEARKRPLLQGGSAVTVLRRLIRLRGPLYHEVACVTVRASQGSPEQVARRIIERLKLSD